MNEDITIGYYQYNKSKNDNVGKSTDKVGDCSLEALCTIFAASSSQRRRMQDNNYFDFWSSPQERAQTSTRNIMNHKNEGINGFIDLKNSNNETDRILVNIKSTSSSLSIISASSVVNSDDSPVAVEDWKDNVGLMDDGSATYSNQEIPWIIDHQTEHPTAAAEVMFVETVLFSKGNSWNDDTIDNDNMQNDYFSRGIKSAPARGMNKNYDYDNDDNEINATDHFTSFRERYEGGKAGKNFASTSRMKASFSKADLVMDDYELYRYKMRN